MNDGLIFIIAGMTYGDEGKGTISEYLTWLYNAKYVVRYNGGPQAAHHVINKQNVLHCFAQFGSGTFAGAKTYLSDKMLIDPIRMVNEAITLEKKGIKDPLSLILIDPECLIVTPFHAIVNQMLEISRGEARHGSCGIGIGQTVEHERQCLDMAPRARDMFDKKILRRKLDFLWRAKIDIAEQIIDEHPDLSELGKRLKQLNRKGYVERLVSFYYNFAIESGAQIKRNERNVLNGSGNIIFEGAQGILLHEKRGFYPYVTYSDTTFQNADEMIRRSGCLKKIIKIGVIRAFCTRHGEGPFPTEDRWLGQQIMDMHNATNEWQGVFRIGWFDLITARYALETIGKIDHIALTNFDRLDNFEKIKVCHAYKYVGSSIDSLDQFFEHEVKENGDIIIKKIKFPSETSIKHQTRLAKLLKLCEPIYKKVEKNKYIEYIEKELKVKISIISVGPKAADKIEVRPLC